MIAESAKTSLSTSKWAFALIGHGFSWLLILLAALLYQERLNIDAAHYVYKVINDEWFRVEIGRLVLALSQILPLFAVKLGLSLKYVLVAYSLNSAIYFYLFFNVFLYGYRHAGAAMSMVLIQLLGLTYGYFTPMYEFYYAIPWVVLCYVLLKENSNRKRYLLMLVSAALAISAHLNGLILLLFVMVVDYLQHKQLRMTYWCIALSALIMVSVFKMLYPSDYESEIMAFNLDFSKNQRYKNLFSPNYLQQLAVYLVRYYWEVMLLLVLSLWALARAKRWWLMGFIALAFAGDVVLIQTMYYGLHVSRYYNQVYFPLVAVASIGFACSLGYMGKLRQQLMAVLIVVLLVFRLGALNNTADYYLDDVAQIKAMNQKCRETGSSKCQTRYANLVHDEIVAGHWSFPIQSLLLSAIDGPDEAVTVNIEKYKPARLIGPNEHIFRFNEIVADTSLNPRYFRLKPGAYTSLQQSLPDSMLEINSWNKLQWQVVNADKLTLPKNSLTSIKVLLSATKGDTVYVDANNNIFFSYHWLKGADTVEWNGLRTAVEVDITKNYTQRIMIQTPQKTGSYVLEIDLVHEGVKWYGQSKQFTVEVK